MGHQAIRCRDSEFWKYLNWVTKAHTGLYFQKIFMLNSLNFVYLSYGLHKLRVTVIIQLLARIENMKAIHSLWATKRKFLGVVSHLGLHLALFPFPTTHNPIICILYVLYVQPNYSSVSLLNLVSIQKGNVLYILPFILALFHSGQL